MRKAFIHSGVALVLALLLAPAMAPAEDGGTVARVTYWTIRDGHQADFEAGLAKHNELHAAQNDPQALLTWQIVTGKREGQYIRGSFGHDWADFDLDPEVAAADAADSAETIDPHIERAEPMIGMALPDWSNLPSGPPAGISRVIYFHVHPGKGRQFGEAVGKVHAALQKVEGGWPPYIWYELATGSLPTFVVSLPRADWAGFDPGDQRLGPAVMAEYGEEEAGKIFQALGEATEHQHSFFAVFRADLSYMPAPAE